MKKEDDIIVLDNRMLSFFSMCYDCKHYKMDTSDKCEAFLNGIPDCISNGSFIHNKPYPNDRGIMFEPKED